MNIAGNDVCSRVFFGDEYCLAAGRGTYVQHVLPVFYVKRERGIRRQWETHLLFGYIPKYDSKRAKLTMTLKENYIPWSIYLDDGWNLEPLECGLYFNTVFGHEFWAKQPAKYSSGYYPFSTKFRPNVFVGQRITKTVPNNRRRYIKSITAFYELSTCDIYFMTFFRNGKADFWDVFGLSLGLKVQLL